MAKVSNETRLVVQLLRARTPITVDDYSGRVPSTDFRSGYACGVKATLDALDHILAELEVR